MGLRHTPHQHARHLTDHRRESMFGSAFAIVHRKLSPRPCDRLVRFRFARPSSPTRSIQRPFGPQIDTGRRASRAVRPRHSTPKSRAAGSVRDYPVYSPRSTPKRGSLGADLPPAIRTLPERCEQRIGYYFGLTNPIATPGASTGRDTRVWLLSSTVDRSALQAALDNLRSATPLEHSSTTASSGMESSYGPTFPTNRCLVRTPDIDGQVGRCRTASSDSRKRASVFSARRLVDRTLVSPRKAKTWGPGLATADLSICAGLPHAA